MWANGEAEIIKKSSCLNLYYSQQLVKSQLSRREQMLEKQNFAPLHGYLLVDILCKKQQAGQWLWLSWQSGRFRFQRSMV